VPAEPRSWRVVDGGGAETLARALVAHGLAAGTDPAVGLVFLATSVPDDPVGAVACTRLEALVRPLVGGGGALPPLVVVTAGAQSRASPVHPERASVWGLARTVRIEHPGFALRLIDVDPGQPDPGALAREIASESEECEVALRGTRRWVHRVVPGTPEVVAVRAAELGRPFALRRGAAPGVEGLRFQATTVPAPGPGEVTLAIECVPIGFKDYLKVVGHLDEALLEETFFEQALGMEAAATVTAVGEGVEGTVPGDAVVVAFPGTLCSRATVPFDPLRFAPRFDARGRDWCCGLGALYTAWVGLVTLARTGRGETVLVHSAAGGVGRFAVQVARHLGARVLVTAGTREKRIALAADGLTVVGDSRSGAFAEEVREATGGRGVDVVIGAVGGEVRDQGLALLAPFGRYVELGKQGMEGGGALPVEAFARGQSYIALDLDQVTRHRPDILAEAVDRVRALVDDGAIEPNPVERFPASRLAEALHRVGRGENIGRVVVDLSDPDVPVHTPVPTSMQLDADEVWLVTGGLGGLGLEVARRLVARGARRLALVGRTGAGTEEARRAVAALEACGARVLVRATDVARARDVEALVAEVIADLGPLRGVVHAAGTTDDRGVAALDGEAFERVMNPKALGALHLHRATAGCDLRGFVLLASVSGLVGNRGQGNYAAANAFLDALAWARHAQGRPATSIDLGSVSRTGMAARDPRLLAYLGEMGVDALSPGEFLDELELAMGAGIPQCAIAHVRWGRWARSHPRVASTPLMSRVVPARALDTAAGAAPHQVEDRLAVLIAGILGTAPERLQWDQPLDRLGFDSLLVTELLGGIQREFGVEVPGMRLLRGATAAEMLSLLRQSLVSAG